MIGFGSCGETKEKAVAIDSTALTLAVLPTADCIPFYYAESQGVFDSLGVNIRLVTFDAAMDADTAFMKGDVDGIVSDLVKACLWKDANDSLAIAMGGELNLSLVTALNARIRKKESLKEKVVGITRHSALDFMADKAMERAGFVSTDLNKPQINNISLRASMVNQNQYDGAFLPEPFASECVARGGYRLMTIGELKLPSMMTVMFGDSVAKARKTEIESIAKAYDIAVASLNADTLKSQLEYLPKEHSVYVPDTLYTPVVFKPSAMPSDSMKAVVKDWLKGRGLIK